jgi:hypothetical protein
MEIIYEKFTHEDLGLSE